MMPGIIISFIFSEHGRLVFCTSPSQNQLTCVPQPVDDATHWFSIQVDTANLPRSAWSYLFAFQQSCLDPHREAVTIALSELERYTHARIFDFTLNRGRDGPKYFLKDYRQVLLADAYGGYNGVVAGNEITRAGCWAHMKRKVIDAEKAAPEIAREALERVRTLYAVERQCKDASVEERLKMRQQQSAPMLAQLRERLLTWKEQLLPKHPMAEAVNYALSQWTELNVFCSDGAVSIDNNVSEREMKRVVLNRKNSLFVGNPRGGRTSAILASLTSTCRRHDIDPQLYLTQLLTNLSQVRKSELSNWLPDQWKRLQAARKP
jgi:transposase